jgi:hypothetical protein
MRLARHKAHIGEVKMHTKYWSENLMGRDLMRDVDVDGRIILKFILKQGVQGITHKPTLLLGLQILC